PAEHLPGPRARRRHRRTWPDTAVGPRTVRPGCSAERCEVIAAVIVVAAAVALVLLGAVAGWAVRGTASRWCGRCGDALRCPTCHPATIGRARVAMHQTPR